VNSSQLKGSHDVGAVSNDLALDVEDAEVDRQVSPPAGIGRGRHETGSTDPHSGRDSIAVLVHLLVRGDTDSEPVDVCSGGPDMEPHLCDPDGRGGTSCDGERLHNRGS
jgi:hypothetical protein